MPKLPVKLPGKRLKKPFPPELLELVEYDCPGATVTAMSVEGIRVHFQAVDEDLQKFDSYVDGDLNEYLQDDEFAGCCGVRIISNFEGDAYPPFMEHELRETLRTLNFKGGLILATTVPDQKAAIYALEQNGFTPSEPFHNPNSGNKVTLWQKTVNQPKPAAARKRK